MGVNKSIGYSVSILNRYSQIYLMEYFSDLNLHGSGQVRIILALSNCQDGISQEELAQRLMVDKATVSRMIRPLLKNGILLRTPNRADKRAYILKLSLHMAENIPEIQKRTQRWTDILSKKIPGDELDSFFKTLEAITENAADFINKKVKNKPDS